ncbi:MAG: carbamoyltransferase C-terminal domain-containing protein [Candidatus Omnitrophota bacterium]
MIVLSICDNHDCGAAIFRDGELLFAINEERLSRKKFQGGFPKLSIKECLAYTGIAPGEIDVVVLASRMTPISMLRLFPQPHDLFRHKSSSFSYLLNLYIILQVVWHYLYLPEIFDGFLSRKIIAGRLAALGINATVNSVGHHEAHAASAYYSGETDQETLVVTLDAMGDGVSLTVNIGSGNSIRRIYEQSGFSAVSVYYSRLTEYLGFLPLRHEGKITSLAGYGQCNHEILTIAHSCFHFIETTGGFNQKNHFFLETLHSGVYQCLNKYSREDVAFNFQKNFENEIVKFISWWLLKTKITRVALAGGIFANVSINHRVKDIPGLRHIYIFPHMGDGGLAIGAGLAFLKLPPFYLQNIYLGSQYTDDYIRSFLDQENVIYSFLTEEVLCQKIADLLINGYTVGHFNGRMEFGPRALGNRSILYRADDMTVMKWLNEKMQRSSFMPFAPVSTDFESESLYQRIDGAADALKFMTLAVDCHDKLLKNSPAGVHIDGTARPQILSENDNPRLYKILQYYGNKKGTATLLNTSFNKHEEPIVCSPQDALISFRECGLDVLVLNNFIIFSNTILSIDDN